MKDDNKPCSAALGIIIVLSVILLGLWLEGWAFMYALELIEDAK